MGSAPEDLTLLSVLTQFSPVTLHTSCERECKTEGGTFMKDDGERRVSSERQVTEGAQMCEKLKLT